MKVCVQWASKGSRATAAATSAVAAPTAIRSASIRQPDEQPERQEYAEKPHGLDTFQQDVEIERGSGVEIFRVAFQKDLR